jgi:nucleotide-binding universal stress UspA family protein
MTPQEQSALPGPAFRHLLVPLDGSKLAEAVLPPVRELARRFGARVTLLHVLERGAPRTVHGQSHLVDEAEATAYLTGVAKELAAAGLQVDAHVHPNLERDVVGSLVAHCAMSSWAPSPSRCSGEAGPRCS